MENLRAYFFNNMYLTGIHAGIQAQHCTAEMFLKYEDDTGPVHTLYDWVESHKTTIILNGGYANNVKAIANFFEEKENPYPWASFYESAEALNGCITSVGIILPESIYDYRNNYKNWESDPDQYERPDNLNDYGYRLSDCVSSYRLMS